MTYWHLRQELTPYDKGLSPVQSGNPGLDGSTRAWSQVPNKMLRESLISESYASQYQLRNHRSATRFLDRQSRSWSLRAASLRMNRLHLSNDSDKKIVLALRFTCIAFNSACRQALVTLVQWSVL
eukprot:scaffold2250_cov399-Prasinococcus_capsulatus_cf.AAC.12